MKTYHRHHVPSKNSSSPQIAFKKLFFQFYLCFISNNKCINFCAMNAFAAMLSLITIRFTIKFHLRLFLSAIESFACTFTHNYTKTSYVLIMFCSTRSTMHTHSFGGCSLLFSAESKTYCTV